MTEKYRALRDSESEEIKEVLDNSSIADNLLQMRVISRGGDIRQVTIAVMKFGDTWFCTSFEPDNDSGRRKMSKSTKSLRTALNREIKKFLDDEGFDDDTAMTSLEELMAQIDAQERKDDDENT